MENNRSFRKYVRKSHLINLDVPFLFLFSVKRY